MVAAATTEATRIPAAVEKPLYLLTTPLGIGPGVGMGAAFIVGAWHFGADDDIEVSVTAATVE
jgi:hypothetical protein